MTIKFIPTKDGGGIGSLKYLLDKKRVANGTAKVLRGNPEHTEGLIKLMRTKQKVTMGVLSFEETSLSESLKEHLMTEFGELVFPGLDRCQYSILWVEHTDKEGRIELNFLIVKLELTTAKPLQPYFHKVDYSRVDAWQQLQNLKYDFTDPLDPRKSRTVQGVHPNNEYMKKLVSLDIVLHKMVEKEVLNSRDEIILFIEKNGGVVSDKSRVSSITVKLDGRRKGQKFKTGIYSKAFTSQESLLEIQRETKRAIQVYVKNREESKKTEIPRLEKKIEEMKKYKERILLQKYPKPKPTYYEEIIEEEQEIIIHERTTITISPEESITIRRRVANRNRTKQEITQGVYQSIKDARERILEGIGKRREELCEQFARNAEELRDQTKSDINRSKENVKSLTQKELKKMNIDNSILAKPNPYMGEENTTNIREPGRKY